MSIQRTFRPSLPLALRWAVALGLLLLAFIIWWTCAGNYLMMVPCVVISLISGVVLSLYIDAIIRQNREHQQLIDELKVVKSELLAAEHQAGVLAERQRLAREIHDTVAQGFTSIVTHLEAAEEMLHTNQISTGQHLAQARSMARVGLTEARRLVSALRPELLEHAPLGEALIQFVERWSQDHSITANTMVLGTAQTLQPEVEDTLLRSAQEALNNVHKHAHAREVNVTLSYIGSLVALDVQDDGIGFDCALASVRPISITGGGFGLKAMRERIEQLGGTLLVESTPTEGTTLLVEVLTGGRADTQKTCLISATAAGQGRSFE